MVAKFTDNLTAVDHCFDLFTEIGSAASTSSLEPEEQGIRRDLRYLNLADEVLGESVGIARDGRFSKFGRSAALAKIEETANGIAELGQSARGDDPPWRPRLSHDGRARRAELARRIGRFREDEGNRFPSDRPEEESARRGLRKGFKGINEEGADIAGAPVEQQIVYETLKRGAEATTYGDLVAAGVYSVDQMNSFHLAAENAAGISTLMNRDVHARTSRQRKAASSSTRRSSSSSSRPVHKARRSSPGREITDFTLGEANQIFREMGMNATGDTPSKIMNEMGEFLNNSFRKVDPEFLEKLRKVDPNAATVFEGHAIAIQQAEPSRRRPRSQGAFQFRASRTLHERRSRLSGVGHRHEGDAHLRRFRWKKR